MPQRSRYLVAAALAAAVFVGRWLAAEELGSSASEQRALRLVFISCAVDSPFFAAVKKGMRDAAERLNVAVEFIGTPGIDVVAQAAMVRQAVADGYDGIALNIIDAEAFDDVIEGAIRAGVPVVAFNVDDHATPNARLSAVSQRFLEAGKALARRVAPHIPAGSHVLMTMHDRGVSALDERLRGLQEILRKNNIRWTVIVTGNDSHRGAEAIATALRTHPDIRVILGSGQSDTEAAGRAIEQHFPDLDYWAAGFDLSPETLRLIKAGHIRCTVDQQPYIQGFYPVVQLTLYLRYGIMPADIDAGAAIIDHANIDRVMELTSEGYR
jgi:simple sugar transport system substrate-binding protein